MAPFIIDPTNNGEVLLNSLLNPNGQDGLSNFQIKPIGDSRAFGTFTDDPFQLGSGIILSTGRVADLNSTNQKDGSIIAANPPDLSTDFGPEGQDGDSITLQIKFDSDGTKNKLYFQYVFGSEEFLEYVRQFNDSFSLKLNNQNLALLPNKDVVNIDNLVGTESFIDNSVANGSVRNDTRLDGYSIPLTFVGDLKTGLNTLEINIQDERDGFFDSAVFLKAQTLGTKPPPGFPTDTDNGGTDGASRGRLTVDVGNLVRPLPSDPTQSAQLLFTLQGVDAAFINEVGVYKVNDDQGGLDLDSDGQSNLFPGDRDYTQAALGQGKVIFSALPNGGILNSTRILSGFKDSDRLAFYLVQNSTTDQVIRGTTPASRVLLGSPFGKGTEQLRFEQSADNALTLKWEDGTNGGDRDFNDVVLTVQTTDQTPPNGTRVQGDFQGEVLDLRNPDLNNDEQPDSVIQATFEVNREAALDNFVGLYRVDNTEGTIGNLSPDSEGYAAEAVKRTIASFSSKDVNQGTYSVKLEKPQLGLLAPYIITNGTPETFLKDNPNNSVKKGPNIYFNYIGANPDKADHLRLLGDNSFGFEDSLNPKSFDFNDVVVHTRLSPIT